MKKKKSSNKKIANKSIWVGSGTAILITLLTIFASRINSCADSIFNSPPKPWESEFKDKKFNILVLKFGITCETRKYGKADIGFTISNELEGLKYEDSLDIGVFYDTTSQDVNFKEKQALELQKNAVPISLYTEIPIIALLIAPSCYALIIV